jgi:hypothetical protein
VPSLWMVKMQNTVAASAARHILTDVSGENYNSNYLVQIEGKKREKNMNDMFSPQYVHPNLNLCF